MENLEGLKTTITPEEKRNILNMFSQLLKERPNTIKDTRNTSIKNTIEQACFISKGLNGEADGIFFPNSIFEMNNSKKDFICLCIYDNKPSMCLSYPDNTIFKSLKDKLYFTSLESVIYSNEELEERKELNSFIEDYQDRIELLKSIHRVFKKDGKDFQSFEKNFSSEMTYFSIKYGSYTNSIELYASKTHNNGLYSRYNDTIYLYGTAYTKENITPSIFMDVIKDTIKKYNDYISEYKNKLKNLHSEALQVEKIFNDLLSKKDSFVNKDFFKKYIDKNCHKLNM